MPYAPVIFTIHAILIPKYRAEHVLWLEHRCSFGRDNVADNERDNVDDNDRDNVRDNVGDNARDNEPDNMRVESEEGEEEGGAEGEGGRDGTVYQGNSTERISKFKPCERICFARVHLACQPGGVEPTTVVCFIM
jgi:hypothetical protein